MAPPVLQYFRSHLFLKLPVPSRTFSGLTVIVTGANSGLGLEASVKAFVARADRLDRLDVVLENAGVLTHDFSIAEDNEKTITVNVINTFLLAFLLLPKLRSTSVKLSKEAVLTFTGSLTHWLAGFPERNSSSILRALADKDKADMRQR
ncbi:hypothetical protein O1611_g1121 [Lasiodiplodia mahajangana]|uniref:Uncharacterized protein n=1 Tax=Lasiodiplodia mahajangana TaxID=1108764 RepID=A0ACC2JYG6_9PEZI|nr:hypothetical protein O1611_g1121 [Lasiodiplodia mahajangana]